MKRLLYALINEWERLLFALSLLLPAAFGGVKWVSMLGEDPSIQVPVMSVPERDIVNSETAWIFLEREARITDLESLFAARPPPAPAPSPPPEEPRTPEPASRPVKPLTLHYLGLIEMSTPVALILDPATGEEYSLPVGGKIHGMEVLTFETTHLVLRDPRGQTKKLLRGRATIISPTSPP